MRGTLRNSLLVCAFAIALAGCGSDDGTIPPEDADNLINQLEAVQNYVEEGECDRAEQQAEELVTAVNELPNDVDPEVAGELTKAAANLDQLASEPEQCTETGASGIGGVEPTDTTDTTETVEPETTTTETTTTDEEPPEEETTTIEPPPDDEPEQDPGQEPPTGNQGGGGGGPTSGGLEPPTGDGKGGKPE
jgi:hypothetical protein